MKPLRLFALVFLVLVTRAEAAPIQAYGGWLDATFRVYDYGYKEINGQTFFYPNELRRDFVLGVDFYPGVPFAFTSTGTDYSVCIDSSNSLIPECKNSMLPWTTAYTPGGNVTPGIFGDPATQTPLADGCDPLGNSFSNHPLLIVARGGCSFLQKWQVAQNGGWGGVLVAETDPASPVAGSAFGASLDVFTVPFLRVTSEVAGEIRRGSTFPDDQTGTRGIPWLEIEVSWSLTPPPPPPVPEPSSLVLAGIGLTLAARRLRRTRRSRAIE